MQQTKLSVLCEKLIEAGWLAAVIVTPLFFNVYSSRVFEPDKGTTLRSIALMMITAWIIKTIETGIGNNTGQSEEQDQDLKDTGLWRGIVDTPMVIPTLLLIVVYIWSTLLSVTPRISFIGSYQRLQGTYTTFSYIVVFFMLITHLRTRAQLERLITTMILSSVPVSLYGAMQHYRMDFLPWGGDVTRKVASNMGNSIFVAAFIIMAVPLTLSRLMETVWELRAQMKEERVDLWAVLLLVGYFIIVCLQLVTVYFAGSRGPWLGLLAGIAFFLFTMALVKRARVLVYLAAVFAISIGGFLAVLNIPDPWWEQNTQWEKSPLSPLKEIYLIGRLGNLLETGGGTGKVRLLIWEGAIDLMTPHEPLWYPHNNQTDMWNVVRPLIGYGPESMYVAYNPFYPPDLAHYEARNASPDRSHNETFDALVITGIIGFVVQSLLFGSFFYFGLKWIGMIANSMQRWLFIGFWIIGAILGAIVPKLIEGTFIFAGVGVPLGIMLGIGIYMLLDAFWFARERTELPPEARQAQRYQVLLVGVLSAVVAHFVEIHFGIAIVATRTFFWVYIALLVLMGYILPRQKLASMPEAALTANSEPVTPVSKGRSRRRRKRRVEDASSSRRVSKRGGLSPSFYMLSYALLAALMMLIMSFDLVTHAFDLSAPDGRYASVWLFTGIWLVLGVVLIAVVNRRFADNDSEGHSAWEVTTVVYAFVSLIWLPIIMFHYSRLVSGMDTANTIIFFYLVIFAMILGIALSLLREETLPSTTCLRANVWLYPVLAVLCAVLMYVSNVSPIRADIYYKQGQAYDSAKQWDGSIFHYIKAIKTTPNEDFYYLFLGRAFLEKAKRTEETDAILPFNLSLDRILAWDIEDIRSRQELATLDRSDLFECARLVLEEAQRINPLNTDHTANLARLYRSWADAAGNTEGRVEFLSRSLKYYQDATRLSPQNAQLFNEWATVYFSLGDYENAIAKYEHSLEIDPLYEATYMGLGDIHMSTNNYTAALDVYLQALEVEPRLVQALSVVGYIYSQQGNFEKALEYNLKVIEHSPDDYPSRKNLAILYSQLGREQEALIQAQEALALAPNDNEAASLQQFVAQLGGEMPEMTAEQLIETYLSQGAAYLSESKWDEAAGVYRQALALSPQIFQARTALGFIYAQQGKLDRAEEELLKALEISPNDYNTNKNLALVYRDMGQKQQSMKLLERALEYANVALQLAPEAERDALEQFIIQLQRTIEEQ